MPRPLGSKNKKSQNVNTRTVKVQKANKRQAKDPPVLPGSEPKKMRVEEVVENLNKKNKNNQESDEKNYCWICHSNEQKKDSWFNWSCCPRVYHVECLKKNKFDCDSETVCPECQLESVDGTPLSKPVPSKQLQMLLLAIMSRKRKDKSFKNHEIFNHWPRNAEDDLVKIMDFETLENKIKEFSYSKASEFFSDIKWILHNCFIYYGSVSPVTSDAKQLVKTFKADLLDMEACYECFYYGISNTENFFLKICHPPHEIIYAKMNKCASWPAKVLKINHGKVYVKFFQTHDIGKDIPISRCHFISKIHPNRQGCPNRVVPALEELDHYVRNYEKVNGVNSFYYYDKVTAFSPENIRVQKAPSTLRSSSTNGNVKQSQRSDASKNTIESSIPKEQSRIPTDLSSIAESAASSSGIDILSRTTTKVVTSTPIVATSDDISSDDLTLGADFSNSFPPELSREDYVPRSSDISPHDLSCASELSKSSSSTQSSSSASFITPPTSFDSFTMPGPSTSTAASNYMGESSSPWSHPPSLVQTAGSSSGDQRSSLFDLLGTVVNSRIMNDMSTVMPFSQNGRSFDIMQNKITHTMVSFILNMWNIVQGMPSGAEVLSRAHRDLKIARNLTNSIKNENNELKSQCSDLQNTVHKLQCQVAELANKKVELELNFHEATNNAKKVVQSIKQEVEQFWKSELKAQKELYEKKLQEKGQLLEECESQLLSMQSKFVSFNGNSIEQTNGQFASSPKDCLEAGSGNCLQFDADSLIAKSLTEQNPFDITEKEKNKAEINHLIETNSEADKEISFPSSSPAEDEIAPANFTTLKIPCGLFYHM